MLNSQNDWNTIWNKKNIDNLDLLSDKDLYENLIKANGFDAGAGKILHDNWINYLKWIESILHITDDDSIFEVGCGAGAFLYYFYKKKHPVAGLDYSSNLINISKKIMPDRDFKIDEAINLITDIKFDLVVSNSIFFYFSSYDYAKQVIEKMILKSNRIVGVFDVPNLLLKKESENERRRLIEDYDIKYKGLEHLYYEKKWFLEIAEINNLNIMIFDQNINNYGNNKFRFNCILIKNNTI